MAISVGTEYMNVLNAQNGTLKQTANADRISSKLNNLEGASDEEKLSACKEFEAYFVEKIIKMMHDSVKSEEEEDDPYLQQFGDMQYEAYAKEITESGQLGLAQQLFEAMKRN